MSNNRPTTDSPDTMSIKKKKSGVNRPSPDSSEPYKRLTSLLGEALRYTANEPVLLARAEEFFSPKPAKLEVGKPLKYRLGRLIEQIGGVPLVMVSKPGDPVPEFDTYGHAAIQEIFSSFERCRRSVCRTHVCFIANEFYMRQPDIFVENPPKDVKRGLVSAMTEVFWEHAETSYIRLASFWDRIGQLLDFVFFNIRQYERDGFPSVMDRISSNYIRVFPDLDSSTFWPALRDYQRSEKTDGFQFLVRRRNLLVHSVHLAAIESDEGEENPIFTSAYNHLEESIHRKLKPDTPESELGFLHAHLAASASLFPEVMELCEHCVESRARIHRGY